MNTYTNKITESQAIKLKDLLESLNADFDCIEFAKWRAKTNKFNATYYKSGKFLIQGKDISPIVASIEQILGTAAVQQTIITTVKSDAVDFEKIDTYIGTDESGKGDFFGPLIIAAVQVNDSNKKLFLEAGVKDSKKLDDIKIRKLAACIKNNSIHSVIIINPLKYNELYDKFKNLNKLLAWGHARAIENVLEKKPCEHVLSDKFGDESLIKNALLKNGRKIKLTQKTKAESDIAVAAASIIARAEFVKRMDEMNLVYNIEFPKGASARVIEQGKLFVKENSKEKLCNVAKLHFKTTQEVFT